MESKQGTVSSRKSIDFNISRRNAIQTGGAFALSPLVVVSGAAADVLQPARNGGSPFQSIRGDHAGLRVSDLDSALKWYGEKLDFRHTGGTKYGEITYAFMAPPNNEDFQIELVAGPGAVDRTPYKDLNESQSLHGWHHLCFRTDSIDEDVAELKRRGVTILGEPFDVEQIRRRIAFFSDPWGNVFELTQPLSG